MGYLFENLWLCMLIATILGLIIGWWIWAGRTAEEEVEYEESAVAPVIPPAPPEPEPVEPEVAAVPVASIPEPSPEPEPAPVVPPVTEPVQTDTSEASPFMAAPDGEPDDLTRIKGVGPKLNALLNTLGVFHFRQIESWDAAQVAEVDSHLASFKGRIARDRWVDQARYLAAGDITGFEAEFGSIGNQT